MFFLCCDLKPCPNHACMWHENVSQGLYMQLCARSNTWLNWVVRGFEQRGGFLGFLCAGMMHTQLTLAHSGVFFSLLLMMIQNPPQSNDHIHMFQFALNPVTVHASCEYKATP